jgi:hypothetical protein
MSQLVKKEVCRCVNCGNEAEMVFTCTLPDAQPGKPLQAASASGGDKGTQKVKASGTCAHCGNEADMWIDL